MNRIRDVETVTCCVCGKECDKIRTREIFTGRVRYICFGCEAAGDKEVKGAHDGWRRSPAGQKVMREIQKRGRR